MGYPGKTDSPKIVFNRHWKKGKYLSLVTSTYSFHFFWWNSTTASSSLSATEPEGDGGGAISGRGSSVSGVGSGGGTCGGDGIGSGGYSSDVTSIFNVNDATAGGFITGATITGSATTALATVSVSSSNTAVKTVKAPLNYCAVLFWD